MTRGFACEATAACITMQVLKCRNVYEKYRDSMLCLERETVQNYYVRTRHLEQCACKHTFKKVSLFSNLNNMNACLNEHKFSQGKNFNWAIHFSRLVAIHSMDVSSSSVMNKCSVVH